MIRGPCARVLTNACWLVRSPLLEEDQLKGCKFVIVTPAKELHVFEVKLRAHVFCVGLLEISS